MDLNRVLLIGNLTRDPETRHTQTGKQVTSFSIAVNDRRGSKDRDNEPPPMFIKIETWGKTAEIAAQYLLKGSGVLVDGRLKIEEYESRDGQKRRDPVVVADQISLGPRPRGTEGGAPSSGPAPRSASSSRPSGPPQRSASSANAVEESQRDYSDDQPDEPAQRGGTEDDLPF